MAIPTDENWHLVVAYPGFALNTAESRAILPKQVELKKTIACGQRLSGFITLCFSEQFEQALSVMRCYRTAYREELLQALARRNRRCNQSVQKLSLFLGQANLTCTDR